MQMKSISELEQVVMDIVWELKGCSVRDVVEKLQSTRKLAYTTVATILQRLYDKGMVERRESKQGYTYYPKLSKQSYSKKLAKSFLGNFFKSYGDTAIASFAETIDELPEKKRKYFLELFNDHEKNK
jgi:BlaI family penicillinase repressor